MQPPPEHTPPDGLVRRIAGFPGGEAIPVRRARIRSVAIYDISEDELTTFQRGSGSIFLNFAIFLLSAAISFTIALFTNTPFADRTFLVLLVLAVLGYVQGLVLLVLWWRGHQSVSALIKRIRERMLHEAAPVPPPD